MSADRELLELAAKAVGFSTAHQINAKRMLLDPPVPALWVSYNGDVVTTAWNPIDDRGHSMGIAVDLGFRVEVRKDGQAYVWLEDRLLWNEFALDAASKRQRTMALCRAITNAAAEIGRSMP